ncbi:hypothetical protein BD769DRAFT_1384257 [Suillus cothurnatus]|nr:hypothetical protein BD769DRAFT_1384257 [Suillus cothurnatus]
MNSLCQFRDWSLYNGQQLLKAKAHGVTLESVKNGQSSDILKFIHGQGKDIKSLLHEVDVEEVEYTDLPDPEPCTEELQALDHMDAVCASYSTLDVKQSQYPCLDAQENSETVAMPTDIDMQLNPHIFVTVGVQCKSIIEHTASPCVMLDLALQTDLEVQDSFCMGDFIQGLYEHVVVQQKSDMSISPSLKSRLREQKITSRGTTMVTHDKQHPSKKPTWPIIFATWGAVSEDGAKVAHKDLQHETYTLDGLIHESKIGAKDIASFLMDTNAIDFV